MSAKFNLIGTISKEGTTSFELWKNILSDMSAEQLLNIVATNNQALGVKKLTDEQILRALSEAGVSDELAEQTVELYKNTLANELNEESVKDNTKANLAFSKTLKGAWVSLKSFLATPVGQFALVVGIFTAAKIAADKLGLSAKGAAEKFEESVSAYAETKNELTSLESELKNVKDRISELNDLSKTGRLTPDQEAELKDLQATNAELDRKIKMLKNIAELQAREANERAQANYRSKKYSSKTQTSFDSSEGKTVSVQLNGADYIQELVGETRAIEAWKTELENRRSELAKLLAGDSLSGSARFDARNEYARLGVELTTLNDTYDEYTSTLGDVVSEQSEIADSITATEGPIYDIKVAILEAIDAFNLLGATEQDVLAHLRDNTSDFVLSAASILAPLAKEYLNAKDQYEKALGDANGNTTLVDDSIIARYNDANNKLQDLLGQYSSNSEFQEIIDDAIQLDHISDDTLGSLVRLVLGLAGIDDAAGDAADSISDLSSHLTTLGDLEEQFNSLSDALAEFRDDGIVSVKTLVELQETFGTTEGFEEFVNIVGNSKSTFQQVQSACNDLAEAFIDEQVVCGNLTEATKDMTIATLENIGVTNAAEVVEAKLAVQRVEAKIVALNEADATVDVIDALYNEAIAGEKDIAAIEALRISHLQAKSACTDFATAGIGVINSLINQAKAADITGKAMQRLVEILQIKKELDAGMYDEDTVVLARETIQRLQGEYEAALSNFETSITISDIKIKPTERDSSQKETKDLWKEEFEAQYNEWKHLLDMEKVTTQEFFDWLNGDGGYKKYFADQTKYADEWRKYEKECFDLKRNLSEKVLDTLDREVKALERQNDTESQVIAKYREKQKVIKELMDTHVRYLKSIGASDAAIKENDYLKELLDSWWDIQDSISGITDSLNDETADSLKEILDMTIEIVKKEKEDAVDALNDQKDA